MHQHLGQDASELADMGGMIVPNGAGGHEPVGVETDENYLLYNILNKLNSNNTTASNGSANEKLLLLPTTNGYESNNGLNAHQSDKHSEYINLLINSNNGSSVNTGGSGGSGSDLISLIKTTTSSQPSATYATLQPASSSTSASSAAEASPPVLHPHSTASNGKLVFIKEEKYDTTYLINDSSKFSRSTFTL
jgi:hypothetical protein